MNILLNDVIKNKSDANDISNHLKRCNQDFIPSLSSYVDINTYSSKLYNNACRYEYWFEQKLVGLLAIYINNKESSVFISNLSIERAFRSVLRANKLLDYCISDIVKHFNINKLILEVHNENSRAIKFYKKYGFIKSKDISNNRIELTLLCNE